MKLQAISKAPKATSYIIPFTGLNPKAWLESAKWLEEAFPQVSFPKWEKLAAGEALVASAGGESTEMIWLLSVGKDGTGKDFRDALRKFFFQQKERLGSSVAVKCSEVNSSGISSEQIEAMAEGITVSQYDIALFKKEKESSSLMLEEVLFLAEEESLEKTTEAVSKGEIIGKAVLAAANWVNLPGNKLDATEMAAQVTKLADERNLKVRVLGKEEAQKERLHAYLAVNQGSVAPPAFIVIEYTSPQPGSPTVGLVGKGVTFDTGGISLKNSSNMYYMKSDMGGAAAVFGAFHAISALKPEVNVIGVIPATDNMPDGGAVKPGDVIDSYLGLTIEVEDTDAEGRLTLADGVAWLNKNHQPDYIMDLATLTGSSVVALGYHAAAMFTHNDELSKKLSELGSETDNRIWRLPLWEDYRSQLHSDVADIRNLGGPAGGSITAAKFIEAFVEKHPNWVHFDIAGVAYGDSPFAKMKSGTGFGVRLLTSFIMQLKKSE